MFFESSKEFVIYEKIIYHIDKKRYGLLIFGVLILCGCSERGDQANEMPPNALPAKESVSDDLSTKSTENDVVSDETDIDISPKDISIQVPDTASAD